MDWSWLSAILEVNLMYVILAAFVVGILVSLWLINSDEDSPLCLTDLITDNGRLSEQKLSRIGAWIVSTWGFVYLIVTNNLSEWYFVGYMGTWVASAILSDKFSTRMSVNKHDDS